MSTQEDTLESTRRLFRPSTNQIFFSMKSPQELTAASWLILDKALRILLGFFISAAIARQLGATEQGILAIAIGTISIFSAAAGMGADYINLAELTKRNPNEQRSFFYSAFTVRFSWGIICVLGFFVFIYYTKPKNDHIYLVLAPSILTASFSIYANKIQAKGEFIKYAKINILTFLIGLSLKILALLSEKNANIFASIYCAEAIILCILFFILSKNKNSSLQKSPLLKVKLILEYIRKCLPTTVAVLFIALFLRIELFAVATLSNEHSAGLWAIVSMFITPWAMLGASVLPIINRKLTHNQDHRTFFLKIIRAMVLLSVPAILINIAFIYLLMPILFGSEYAEAQNAMVIASAAIPLLLLGSIQDVWIAQKGNTSVTLKKVAVGLPLSAGILIAMVPQYGIDGAAISLVSTYIVTTIFLNFFFDKEYFKIQIKAMGLT